MGNDYYEWPETSEAKSAPMEIGQDCQIEGAIIDKNARIGKGVVIKKFPVGTDLNGGWLGSKGRHRGHSKIWYTICWHENLSLKVEEHDPWLRQKKI